MDVGLGGGGRNKVRAGVIGELLTEDGSGERNLRKYTRRNMEWERGTVGGAGGKKDEWRGMRGG